MRRPAGATAGKLPLRRPTRRGNGTAMGHGRKGRKTDAGGIRRKHNPWEWRGSLGAARPPEWTPLPRFLPPQIPAGLCFFSVASVSPHGGPESPPRRLSRRGLYFRRSCQPAHPPVALLPRFFACPTTTPSACHSPTPAPPQGIPSSSVSASDVSLIPPLHPSFSFTSPVPSLPSSRDPYGRSPLPSRSCPRPPPPIFPVRTKILAIGPVGLSRAGRWRAGPRPVGKSPVGLA